LKTGAGTLTLTNVNTYSGNTVISGGTLAIGGAGQLGGGVYQGVITNNGLFVYASSADQTLSGYLIGSGTLTKTNSGTLVISGTNTSVSGVVNIDAGRVVMGDFQAMGKSATIRVRPGSALDMHGYCALSRAPVWTSVFSYLHIGGTGPDGKGALLNSTGVVANVAAGGYTWLSGHGQNPYIYLTSDALFNLESAFGQLGAAYANTYLFLNGYTLTKSGPGSYYMCNTVVSNGNLAITGGKIIFDKSNSVIGSRIQGPGWVAVGDGEGNGALSLDAGQTAGLITRPMILNGGRIIATGNAQLDSPVTLNATNAANTVETVNTSILVLAGALDGEGGLTKAGAGTLVLTNANTYVGDTVVSAGTLELTAPGNGTLSDNTTVRIEAGARMKLASGVNERVKYLYLNGVRAWVGTWGSTSSSAVHKNDTYFAPGSSGVLDVRLGPGGTLIRVL